ncbi:alpha/beta hydrolase [Cyanobium sp. Alchichica 3B3-8F6]|nr:alpha/beta hydrolase [Cyanobium sp. Alchichica 3B3-8F6]
MIMRLLSSLFVGTALSVVALPMLAAGNNNLPVRWSPHGSVRPTNQDALNTFLESGEIINRCLELGLNRSGWTAEEMREGMKKLYGVDFIGVSRFLFSEAGEKFLNNQIASYFPSRSLNTHVMQALRSAILADARDAQISSAGIINALLTDMRQADFCDTTTGAKSVRAEGPCQGDPQPTSMLSGFVFLPAYIQANQMADPFADMRATHAPFPQVQP